MYLADWKCKEVLNFPHALLSTSPIEKTNETT